MSPFHFHRLFKARLGITPKQYQTAHRLERFKLALRQRPTVASALYEAGFGSHSRAYENVGRKLGMSPRQYQAQGDGVRICYGFERTRLGWIMVAATARGVCVLQFDDSKKVLRERLFARFPRASLREDKPSLAAHFKVLAAFLKQPQLGLSLPLDIRGTIFQQRVWQALQKIPVGRTATYGQIARRIGAPKAVRAVGSACGANPVALAIPCHRVVPTGGGIGFYRWGVKRKEALLRAENAIM